LLKRYFLLLIMAIALVVIVGCEADPDEDVVEEPIDEEIEEPAEDPGNLMGLVEDPLSMDGSSEGYPAEPIEAAGASIYLAYDEEFMYVLMEAEAEGWLSVGINQSGGGMDGANMILGYLSEEGEPAFRDDVGSGHTHSEADVTAISQPYFERTDGISILEFAYPLSFPDDEGYNVEELIPGEEYSLIVGLHQSSDNIDSQHSTRGMADFTVEP